MGLSSFSVRLLIIYMCRSVLVLYFHFWHAIITGKIWFLSGDEFCLLSYLEFVKQCLCCMLCMIQVILHLVPLRYRLVQTYVYNSTYWCIDTGRFILLNILMNMHIYYKMYILTGILAHTAAHINNQAALKTSCCVRK